ncbi:hypothetical protein ACQ33O_01745 [Ferruginibacter sp. SUN002]|uniref:hypothetical protein n=1 Tax=Ferruginibacter sp. SUN002 TaxID=2937789 RepID=UPI003D360B81
MKAIIYAGIGLFAVASVYGVADYYQSKKQGLFLNLYKEPVNPIAEEDERTINADDYSRGEISEPSLAKKLVVTTNSKTAANTKAVKKKKAIKTSKAIKKRNISFDKFSRAKLPVERDMNIDTLSATETALFDF